MVDCIDKKLDNRKVFWTNFINVKNNKCFDVSIPILSKDRGVVLHTSDYIRSLVINILFTQAEGKSSLCGEKPSMRGGHWSTSFTGIDVGTNLDFETSAYSIDQVEALGKSTIKTSLNRLIDYGIATNIEVNSFIDDNDVINFQINVYSFDNRNHRILLNRNESVRNIWVWN